MIFVDFEKAYDRVPRYIIWWALRKKHVEEKYIKVIQDMYDGCTTSVTTLIGSTESFEVKVGLHQGSALSPLLFITIMDVISQEVGREPPHAMLFADDLVLCEKQHVKKQKNSLNYGERLLRTRDYQASRTRFLQSVIVPPSVSNIDPRYLNVVTFWISSPSSLTLSWQEDGGRYSVLVLLTKLNLMEKKSRM